MIILRRLLGKKFKKTGISLKKRFGRATIINNITNPYIFFEPKLHSCKLLLPVIFCYICNYGKSDGKGVSATKTDLLESNLRIFSRIVSPSSYIDFFGTIVTLLLIYNKQIYP